MTMLAFDVDFLSGTLLDWLLRALIYGTALAVVTWLLLGCAFRRVRPAIHAAFWSVVLLKFVVPVGPGWSYSLANLVDRTLPTVAPAAASTEPKVVTTTIIGAALPIDSTAITTAPVRAPTANEAGRRVPWATVVAVAYLVGLIVVAAVRIRSAFRTAAAARRAPLIDDDATEIVADACRRLKIRRVPTLRRSDAAPAPYILNAWRPTLVLSRQQLADRNELEAVVLHELAHLRRGDLLVRYVQWLAGTILYFWPVVAWVNRRIDLARELACDEWALRHGRLSPTQYARCLLRATAGRDAALQRRSGYFGFAPAAMAANASHVERRIEMIINTASQPRRRRVLGVLAGAAFCGWAGFVLTGATGAATAGRSAQPDDGACAPTMMWIASDTADFEGITLPNVLGPAAWTDVDGDVQIFVAGEADMDGSPPRAIAMHVVAGLPPRLADFAARHPSADADGDGSVSRAERDAYLIALALRAPAGVLQQYPSADRNGDGVLDADEAARLIATPPTAAALPRLRVAHAAAGQPAGIPDDVLAKLPADVAERIRSGGAHAIAIGHSAPAEASGEPRRIRIMRKVTNENGTITEETQEGDQPPVIRVFRAGDPGAPEPSVILAPAPGGLQQFDVDCTEEGGMKQVRVVARAIDGNGQTPTADAGRPFQLPLPTPPGVWLIENIDATPSSADVRRYLPVAEAVPLRVFLEANPKADRNGDGVLTAEERDEYMARHQTAMRSRILEKHPDADANGDGVLTDDEMRTFFQRRLPRPNADGDILNVVPPGGGAKRVMIRQVAPSTEGATVEVEVLDVDDAGPR